MKISEKALKKMPNGHFVRFDQVKNQSGFYHNAVLWLWSEGWDIRSAWFDIETGEYLTEEFIK
jgi:hypothetical protein